MSMSQPMQVLTSHETHEWYTPVDYIDMVYEVMGRIDVDPASADFPQSWIKAKTYYTVENSGLKHAWIGKVFLNPSYGKDAEHGSQQAYWSRLLEGQYLIGNTTEAILLINSTHGYVWYEDLWSRWPCCCVRERISFVKPDGTQGAQAKRGQTFIYFGRNYYCFIDVFKSIGRIILP